MRGGLGKDLGPRYIPASLAMFFITNCKIWKGEQQRLEGPDWLSTLEPFPLT